jgi:hypothetical protein
MYSTHKLHKYDSYQFEQIVGLGLMCLTHISTIFQLYHGGQLYWWKKSLFPYKTTDLSQLKLSYLSSFNITAVKMYLPSNFFSIKFQDFFSKQTNTYLQDKLSFPIQIPF